MLWENAEEFGFEFVKKSVQFDGEMYTNGSIEVWIWPLDEGMIELEVISDEWLCSSKNDIAQFMDDLEEFIYEDDYFYVCGILKPDVSVDDVIEKFIKGECTSIE